MMFRDFQLYETLHGIVDVLKDIQLLYDLLSTDICQGNEGNEGSRPPEMRLPSTP